MIVEVNEPWRRFALENGQEPGRAAGRTGIGSNYLEICAESIGESSAGAPKARDGIQGVLAGTLASFSEYPCHGPDKQRWFSMTGTPLGIGGKGVVICPHRHHGADQFPRLRAGVVQPAAALLRSGGSRGPVDLPLEQAVPCGLIISELVSPFGALPSFPLTALFCPWKIRATRP